VLDVATHRDDVKRGARHLRLQKVAGRDVEVTRARLFRRERRQLDTRDLVDDSKPNS
jgi:hypothetical protein